MLRQNEAALALQHPHDGEGDGHQRGLGIFGEGEFLGRSLEHQLGETLSECLVHLVEDVPGRAESGGEVSAHTDGLAP